MDIKSQDRDGTVNFHGHGVNGSMDIVQGSLVLTMAGQRNQLMRHRDWIICWDSTQGEKAYAMECLRCGELQKMATPITIDRYCAVAKIFSRDHARCKPKK